MKNKLSHFAIHVDEIDRAEKFYAQVFGWAFNPYGPPGFSQIKSNKSDEGVVLGALQDRTFSSVEAKVIGWECTIAVERIDEIIDKVQTAGGQVVMPKSEIPTVGWIAKFLDTEGNLFCAMQYL